MVQKNSPYGINFACLVGRRDYKIIPTSRDIPQGKNKNYSGFSFIEAILAVFLIATGMIAVMSLMSSSLKDSMGSRDQIIGVLLSQEGIELVRNLRDNNWANNVSTFENFPSGYGGINQIDANTASFLNSSNYLNFSSNVGYNYSSGDSTKFRRNINIIYYDADGSVTQVDEAVSAEIMSTVIWNNGSFPAANNCNTSTKCAYTQTTLTSWGGM